MDSEVQELIARLIAHGPLPKTESDKVVMRALIDQQFRDELDRRLDACGLCLLDNPYASHIGIGLRRDAENLVLTKDDHLISNTFGLNRKEVALLVVLWALIILPKRERQQNDEGDAQGDMLPAPRQKQKNGDEFVSKAMIVADFPQLGAESYITRCLAVLARHKFIVMDGDDIREGPLLDLAFDYNRIAARVIEGAVGEFARSLKGRHIGAAPEPAKDSK